MQSSAILIASAYRMSISCWLGPTSWWEYSTSMPSFSSASTVSRRTSEPASSVVELLGVDREGLQLAEDVGEPQPDEADPPLVDDRLDVFGALRPVIPVHGRETSQPAAATRWTGGPASVQPAVGPALELGQRR